jgi:hypothetical protein
MATYTRLLTLLPLLAGGFHAQAQQALALAKLSPQTEPSSASGPHSSARGTSLESILRSLKAEHHALFLYRSEVVKDKYVALDGRTFRTWEEKLTYVVTMCDLRVEKTGHNLYVISAPKKAGASLPAPKGEAEPVLASQAASSPAAIAATVTGQITGPDQAHSRGDGGSEGHDQRHDGRCGW